MTDTEITIHQIKPGSANQLLGVINAGTANEWKTLSGTSNQINITNGAGTITLSTPQDIATSSTPTFASETLTAVSNQLTLGTTRTVTLTAPTPATASRTVTVPDLSGDYSVVGTIGAQTISGIKTFNNNINLNTNHIVMVGDGSPTVPSISGSTSTQNGISFEIVSNSVSIVTNGTEKLRVDGSDVVVPDFTGVNYISLRPGVGFFSDAGTGIGLHSIDALGLVAGASWACVVSKVTDADAAYRDTFTMFNGGNNCYEKFKNGTTISISTSPVKIMTIDEFACWVFISGNDGTNFFADLVVTGFQGSVSVIHSTTISGAPTARTYTLTSSDSLNLAMASGTYRTNVSSLQLHSR